MASLAAMIRRKIDPVHFCASVPPGWSAVLRHRRRRHPTSPSHRGDLGSRRHENCRCSGRVLGDGLPGEQMEVVAISIGNDAWRWRIVDGRGKIVAESDRTFQTIAIALGFGERLLNELTQRAGPRPRT